MVPNLTRGYALMPLHHRLCFIHVPPYTPMLPTYGKNHALGEAMAFRLVLQPWLFQTSRWVGLKLATDFPSGPRSCCLGLPSLVFWPNHKLVQFKDLAL